MIPGVSTGIDLDSGLHIDGFDSMHNLISVDGVPLYGPGHLFGFFPIFNMIHHGTMTVSPVADHVGRLGGSLDMSFDRALPQRTGIALNVGTIALDGSAAVKLGPKAAVFVSGRHSFLSSLYSRKLKIEDMPMDYSMDDVNLTLLVRPGGNDLVWADAFFSNDALGLGNCLIDEGTLGSAWKNGFASLHWQHSAESWSMDQTAYFSAFSNRTEVHAIDMDLVLPNSFSTIGYSATLTAGRLFAGLDAGIHAAEVQDPQETLGARAFPSRRPSCSNMTSTGAGPWLCARISKASTSSRTAFPTSVCLSSSGILPEAAGGRSAPSARTSPTSSRSVRTLSASLPNCSFPNCSISVSMSARCMT